MEISWVDPNSSEEVVGSIREAFAVIRRAMDERNKTIAALEQIIRSKGETIEALEQSNDLKSVEIAELRKIIELQNEQNNPQIENSRKRRRE